MLAEFYFDERIEDELLRPAPRTLRLKDRLAVLTMHGFVIFVILFMMFVGITSLFLYSVNLEPLLPSLHAADIVQSADPRCW